MARDLLAELEASQAQPVMAPEPQMAPGSAPRDLIGEMEVQAEAAQPQSWFDSVKSQFQDLESQSIPLSQGVATAFGQGMTLGTEDEMRALIDTWGRMSGEMMSAMSGFGRGSGLTPAQMYEEEIAKKKAEREQFAQENPGIALGAEIAGGIATGAPMVAPIRGGVKELMKQGAKVGGTTGAIYGAGTADPGDRIEGALEGGATGLAAGAAVPAVVSGLGAAGGKVWDGVKRTMGVENDDAAVEIISEVADRAGITPEIAAQRIDELGGMATLADVDESFLGLLKNAVNKFSPAKEGVRSQFRERLLAEHDDTIKTLSQRFGDYSADDVFDALEASARERSSTAGPLYKSAFDQDLPTNDLRTRLESTDAVKKALKEAEKYAKDDLDRLIDADGLAARPLSDVERYHYAKKALWDRESLLKRTGKTNQARDISKLRQGVTDLLDEVPDYGDARRIWSGSMEADAAADIGRDFFKANTRDFAKQVERMNPHEKEMAKMGVLSSAADKIEGTADKRSVARMLVDKESNRKKLRALFGGDQEIEDLVANADKWDTFRRSNKVMSQQTRTNEEMGIDKAVDALSRDLKGGAWNTLKSFFKRDEVSPKTQKRIAEILSKQNVSPKDIETVIKAKEIGYVPALISGTGTRAGAIQAEKAVEEIGE